MNIEEVSTLVEILGVLGVLLVAAKWGVEWLMKQMEKKDESMQEFIKSKDQSMESFVHQTTEILVEQTRATTEALNKNTQSMELLRQQIAHQYKVDVNKELRREVNFEDEYDNAEDHYDAV